MNAQTPWIKAQASASGGQCVEMRRNGQRVEVRDTKTREAGPVLRCGPGEFWIWVGAAKTGELDSLSL